MTISRKAPWHLWLVGLLGTFWNGFGALDYTMTQTHNRAWYQSMMGEDADAVMQWMDRAPFLADLFWALGVWFGLAGCLLLLTRKSWAVPALAISLVGAVGSLVMGHLTAADRPAAMSGASYDMVAVTVVAIAFGLFIYARRLRANDVLS